MESYILSLQTYNNRTYLSVMQCQAAVRCKGLKRFLVRLGKYAIYFVHHLYYTNNAATSETSINYSENLSLNN